MAEPGSWKPDPDDSERLRWRTDAGEWTDYTAAGSEVATVPVKAGRKRRKWPWIVLACFVVIGVVVNLTEEGQPPVARAPTTTAAASSDLDNDLAEACHRLSGHALDLLSEDIPSATLAFNTAVASDDIQAVQQAYSRIGTDMDSLNSTVNSMESLNCSSLVGEEMWNEMVDSVADMDFFWELTQSLCREDIEPVFDFDC